MRWQKAGERISIRISMLKWAWSIGELRQRLVPGESLSNVRYTLVRCAVVGGGDILLDSISQCTTHLGTSNAKIRQACSTCVTNGRSCSYDANVKKRGLPEGYVRGLEKRWGIAIKEVNTIENGILTALAGNEDNESVLSVWNDESEPNSI
jgi:hypothetical protein